MLTVGEAQLEALGDAGSDAFETRCVAYVDETFPDYTGMYGEEGVRKRVRVDLQRARMIGMTQERALQQYIYLSLALGNNFDLEPGYAWLGSLMREGAGTADERMHRALEAFVDRVERDQPIHDGEG